MILVLLGTQDKSFKRLLDAVDKEIVSGNIQEDVIVQAGYTKYISENMKIFDLVSQNDLDSLMKKARIIITHGGVGSILSALSYQKPVIAAARLSRYLEHTNDHQVQIIKEFSNRGYILSLINFDELGILIKKCATFKAKKYTSNNQKFVKMIDSYIQEKSHISWWNSYKYILFCVFLVLLLLLIFFKIDILLFFYMVQ